MANLAKFTINSTPSSPGGFDMTPSLALTFLLEGAVSSLVNRWTLEVYDANDANSPRASKNAPTLALTGATAGQKVDASTPSSAITSTAPSSGVHSYIVRSKVNGGLNAKGKEDPDYVYERIICIKTGSGLRKVIATEQTQYGSGGWADAQNDLIDAGAGPLTAPGGAADANKIALANGSGANLAYAAALRIENGGTYITVDAATTIGGLYQRPSAAATDNARRVLDISGQYVTGNTDTSGGTVLIHAGNADGSGGTHRGGLLELVGGAATGASGTRKGGDVWVGPGWGAVNGNTALAPSNSGFNPDTFNWQGMANGWWFANGTGPTGDLANGFAHWADGGRPAWRFVGTTLRLDGTATTATAGAQTLPSNPAGFLTVVIGGTTRKIPYYAN